MTTRQQPVRHREIVGRLAEAQKSNRGAPGYSRWVNRRLGRHIAAIAFRAGLTPNQVTVVSALLTFSAIVLLAALRPSWPVDVPVAALLILGYAFDSADGQLARLRGGGTPAGEWLDHIFDALKASAFHIAVCIMWFRFYDIRHPAELLIPLVFAVAAASFFFGMILTDMLRRIDRVGAGGSSAAKASLRADEAAPALRSLIVLPNDYGVLCLLMALAPLHRTFEAAYTVLAAANVVFLVVGLARWFREMTALTNR